MESVWLSGCEAESRSDDELWPVAPETCERLSRGLRLHPGDVFTEEAFDADRTRVLTLLQEDARATARVSPFTVFVTETSKSPLIRW